MTTGAQLDRVQSLFHCASSNMIRLISHFVTVLAEIIVQSVTQPRWKWGRVYTETYKNIYTFHLKNKRPAYLATLKSCDTTKQSVHIYIYIYSKVGDLKAPFSKATTPRCRRGRYSFPWVAPLYP